MAVFLLDINAASSWVQTGRPISSVSSSAGTYNDSIPGISIYARIERTLATVRRYALSYPLKHSVFTTTYLCYISIPFGFVLEPMYWIWHLKDLTFLRNHVVAPVAEEFVFRACMLPLLLQCFRPMTVVFVAPLFFGVGKSMENGSSPILRIIVM